METTINGKIYHSGTDKRFAGCEFCDVRIKDYKYFLNNCPPSEKMNRPCGTASYLKIGPESGENTVDTRPEWEYLTIETAKPIGVKELDKRGSEGWMMCGTSYAGHFYYYFKRQKLS